MAKDKTAKIDIIPPKKGAFMIETAPDFFKLHPHHADGLKIGWANAERPLLSITTSVRWWSYWFWVPTLFGVRLLLRTLS